MPTTLLQRLARIAPYFRASRAGFGVAIVAAAVAAATEPVIPAMLKTLLDEGFGATRSFSLWMVPVIIIGLSLVRGAAAFSAQYALAWAANRGVLALREAMFTRLLNAAPALFTRHNASSLTNTMVYEVQAGAGWLVQALLVIVRDSLTTVALFGYLMWLNWKLTLLVALLAPAVALVMRAVSRRLDRLTRAHQAATDELAYVVEENVLAWRIVRLHGATSVQGQRFGAQSQRLRQLMVKSVAAAATSSPITQTDRRGGAVGRGRDGAVAERRRRRPRHHGRRLCRLRRRDADAGGAAQAPVGQCRPADARPGRARARHRSGRTQPRGARRQLRARAGACAATSNCAGSAWPTATTRRRRSPTST